MRDSTFERILSNDGPDRARRSASRRPRVNPPGWQGVDAEPLEQRRMLSTTLGLDGTLTTTATSEADTIVVFRTSGIGIRVKENGTNSSAFDPNLVNRIEVFGQDGADTITVEGTNSLNFGNTSVGRPTKLHGGNGNDIVNGSDNNDAIYGDAGDDNLSGNELDDTIYGGLGYDTLDGGADNDALFGGSGGGVSDDTGGFDRLIGGAGNDNLYGEGGGDYLEGDGGADLLYGGDGNDTIDGRGFDISVDTLDGGNGTDCGWWDDGLDQVSNMEGKL